SSELRSAHIAAVHASVGPTTPPGKQREERRAEWKTQRRQVIKVPGGAVLRGCKKTKRKLLAHFQLRAGVHSLGYKRLRDKPPKAQQQQQPAVAQDRTMEQFFKKSSELRAAHIASVHASVGPTTPPGKQREERRAEWKNQTKRKLMAHFQLRAGVHSQLRVIASLYVLRIFLTRLVGYCTPGLPSAPTPPTVQPPRAPDAAPLPTLPLRVPAQPAAMDMDWAPEAEPDPEPEPEPEPEPAPPTLRPPTLRPPCCPPPPTSSSHWATHAPGQRRSSHAAAAAGFFLNTDSPELQAAHLDKAHVNDLIEEAAKQRRLLALEEGDSLQDTVPLPCRMRHAVHVCRCLEQWQQPPTTPVPGKPKRGGRRQLGLTREKDKVFCAEPARSNHWDRWFSTGKLANQGFEFERTVETDGVSVCVHYTRPLPTPPAPPSVAGPSSSNISPVVAPSVAAVAAHELGLPRIGKGLAEQREYVFNPATQIGVGIDPGVTQAVSAASGVWDPTTGQLLADQLRRWKLTKGQVKHGSGLNNARRDTERWLAPIKPHLQHLAAASSVGTSVEANLKHITVTLATWDAVWEVYLDPKWAEQRLRLYGAQDRTMEQFFKKVEEDMAEVSMQRHGHAKQLVVFFGAASIGTGGGWGADAVLRACCKVVCRTRGTDQRRGRVVLVDEHRTTRVSSAVNGQQPCERQLNKRRTTRPANWKPPAGQVEPRLLSPAWSQQRDQPVRGMMWCPVVAPRKPPQPLCSSQAATQPTASEPGPSTPPPVKRSKRTKAEQAAEPTQPTKGRGKGKGKAATAKPAPQPGRWVDRDCNAALNMQRIGESKWRPLELCYWPEQGKLPAKGKEYPGLGYKRVRGKPPKAQQQQQQPAD
ncbi:hypothetical protein QJQ45_028450, partial [Haematococcus lacustris]